MELKHIEAYVISPGEVKEQCLRVNSNVTWLSDAIVTFSFSDIQL